MQCKQEEVRSSDKHIMLHLLLLLCVVVNGYDSQFDSIPLAYTPHLGIIQGCTLQSHAGHEFYAFSGIPYAEPPINELRFEPPVPFKGKFEIFNARNECSVCLQQDYVPRIREPQGSEDCLCLNVYTRKLPNLQYHPMLDVLFVIHGGSYVVWSGNRDLYGPGIMMDREIVMVTINYRLGFFGFFSTGDQTCPGNMGLKDQTMALRWVQDNIFYFGGNPNSVTINGESVGGSSVNLHMLSPLSKGLFHRAISESGVATTFWAVESTFREIQRKSKKLAVLLECPTHPSELLLECLKSRPASKIVTQNPAFLRWKYYPSEIIRPVVEGYAPDAFLPDFPARIIRSGHYNKVPWLVGYNRDEGANLVADFMTSEDMFYELQRDPDNAIEHALDYDLLKQERKDEINRVVRNFYFGDPYREIGREDASSMTEMITDRHYLAETYNCVVGISKTSPEPVFFYRLSHVSNNSYAKVFANTTEDFGVSHIDELQYLFDINLFPRLQQPEKFLSEMIVSMFVNFMHTGNPTPDAGTWTSVDPNNVMLLNIDLPYSKMMEFDAHERVALWSYLRLP